MARNSGNAVDIVSGADLIVSAFGYWPSFHDAEIFGFSIRRGRQNGGLIDEARILMRHWGQDNPNYTDKERNYIVEFYFKCISSGNIEFNNLPDPGWIDEICIEKMQDGVIRVDVRPLSGFNLFFKCASVEVVGIKRCAFESKVDG